MNKKVSISIDLAKEAFDRMYGDYLQIDQEWGDGIETDPYKDYLINSFGLFLCNNLSHDFGYENRANKCYRCKIKK